MPNIDTNITYYSMRLFNALYDITTGLYATGKTVMKDMYDYMTGKHNTWYFLNDRAGPLPAAVVSDNTGVEWVYHLPTNTLAHNSPTTFVYNIFWLSAELTARSTRYSLDDFIHSLSYKAPADIYPTPKLLMNMWSLHSGIWLSAADTPVLHIITSEGDEVSIDITNYTRQTWYRLLGVDQTETNTPASNTPASITPPTSTAASTELLTTVDDQENLPDSDYDAGSDTSSADRDAELVE